MTDIENDKPAALGLKAEYAQQRTRCQLLFNQCKAKVAEAETADDKIAALTTSLDALWSEMIFTGMSLSEDLAQCVVDVEDMVSGLEDDGLPSDDDDDVTGIHPDDADFLIGVITKFRDMLNIALPATPAAQRPALQKEINEAQEAIDLVQELTLSDDGEEGEDEPVGGE